MNTRPDVILPTTIQVLTAGACSLRHRHRHRHYQRLLCRCHKASPSSHLHLRSLWPHIHFHNSPLTLISTVSYMLWKPDCSSGDVEAVLQVLGRFPLSQPCWCGQGWKSLLHSNGKVGRSRWDILDWHWKLI